MEIKIHVVGFDFRDGTRDKVVSAPEGSTIGDVLVTMEDVFPIGFNADSIRMKILLLNKKNTTEQAAVHDGDEIIVMRGITGG